MTGSRVIQCTWTGIEDDEGRAVGCDRPAVGYVAARDGRRIYTCDEHVAHAKREAGSGEFVRAVRPDDLAVPRAAHGVSRQAAHQESTVGGRE